MNLNNEPYDISRKAEVLTNVNKFTHRALAVFKKNLLILLADKRSLIIQTVITIGYAIGMSKALPNNESWSPNGSAFSYSMLLLNSFMNRTVIVMNVEDRAKNFRSTFKLMGLSKGSYIFGSLMFHMLEALVFNTIGFICLLIMGTAEWSLFPPLILFAMTSVLMFSVVSVFLTNSETAPNFASLFSTFVFLASIVFLQLQGWWVKLICVVPTVFMTTYLKDFYDKNGETYIDIIICCCTFVAYLILYIWLDNIVSEEGELTLFKNCSKKKIKRESVVSQQLIDTDDEEQAYKINRRDSDTSKTILETYKVTKRFGSFKALTDVSLKFKEGRITCILGQNGAGKSTLINVCCGVLGPTSGEIYLNEKELTHNLQLLEGRVGYCPAYEVIFEK